MWIPALEQMATAMVAPPMSRRLLLVLVQVQHRRLVSRAASVCGSGGLRYLRRSLLWLSEASSIDDRVVAQDDDRDRDGYSHASGTGSGSGVVQLGGPSTSTED